MHKPTSNQSIRNNLLLPLVRDLHRLALCANRGIRRRLLRGNGKLLILKLGKGHGPDRHQTHFLETLEALEYGCEVVLVDVAGNVLQEERLVGSHVFVGHSCRSGFGGARLLGGHGVGLRLRVFFCALEICMV